MMAAAGVPVLDELDPDTVTDRPAAGADQGVGGRRRPRHAGGPRIVRTASTSGGRTPRGAVRVRRSHGVLRALPGHRPPRRGAGARRRARHRVGGRRTRVLDPAAPPEDHRGGAVAARRTHPGHARQAVRRGTAGGEAIGYTGAGTVEFMADEDGDFFFLEMNTRLQVEHPVTEATTGLDLVELQLQVADGGRLDPEPPPSRGLFDRGPALRRGPGQELAAAGRLGAPLRGAQRAQRNSGRSTGLGVRVDSGVVDGSVVSVFYDPMLAKVISYAPTRTSGRRRCWPTRWPAPACTACAPTATCWSTCCGIRRSSTAPPTRRSSTPTAWPSWPRRWPIRRAVDLSALAAALADAAQNRDAATVFAAAPSGWRNLASGFQAKRYTDAAGESTRCATASAAAALRAPGHDAVAPGVGDARPGGAGGRRRRPPVRRRPLRRRRLRRLPAGPGAARSRSRASPIRPPRSRTARCSRRCRARCCASAPRSATPSPPASR